MRGVIAHFLPLAELTQRLGLPGRDDDLLCLGQGHTHLAWEPTHNTYAHIAAQFPPGWQPEVYIHWSLEYNPVPLGLEAADCYTVGIVGDWNLGGQALQGMGGVFDLLLADKKGCERLKAAGYENVRYARLWAYDPGVHRRLSGVERDLDVVLVGSFNHEVQKERAKWLARVAKLSRKYRVHLTQGVYGDEYARLLSRAKIVFNRSIGGGINMRAYEATACGALLFNERDGNIEIEEIFTDREECVLYGEDDLEELLDYYLTHDAERERIAEAGWRKVQAHSYAHHVAQAMNTIEAAMAEKPRAARPFLSLPTGERLFRHACQRLLMDPRNLGPAEEALIEAERLLPARSDIANARACTLARFAECLPDGPERRAAAQQAARHVRRALELQPDDAVAWFNLAQIQLALSNPIIAADALHRAITLLQAENLRAEQVRGPYHAAQFQAFAVELESVWCTHRAETEAWVEGLRSVLLWRAWEQLSDIAFESGRFAEAAETAARAIALRPNLSGTRYRRARALRMLGMLGEAETEYRRALAETPLHPQMWVELAEMLRDSKQYDKCRNFLAEVEDMVNGCPCYEPFRPGLQTLFATLEQAACAGVGRTLRLLALPDWNLPEQWQPLLRRYVQHFGSEEPVLLALPVEPERHPCVEAIVAGVERFLQEAFGASLDSIPDVTLWPYPSEPAFRSLPQADAMVQTRGPEDAQQAAALGVPLFAPEHLARIRT